MSSEMLFYPKDCGLDHMTLKQKEGDEDLLKALIFSTGALGLDGGTRRYLEEVRLSGEGNPTTAPSSWTVRDQLH